eukprot:jgi/Ulvmu1/5663/UM024_0010.1
MGGARRILGLIRSINLACEQEVLNQGPVCGVGFQQTRSISRISFHSAVASASQLDKDKEVDEINRLFGEAREELEGAREDQGTRYFNESATMAKEAVDETLCKWSALLEQVPEAEKQSLNRSMGLKMEQLKAEVKELDHLHDDD